MNYAVLRVKKRSLREAAAMARHALREVETPNADPTRTHLNTIVTGKTTTEIVARIKEKTDPIIRRKDAVRVVEFLIGGSNEALNSKTEGAQNRYFADSMKWIGNRFGGTENIVMAVIHRDETTPHVQLLLTPILNGKLNAKELIGGPKGLRELHDAFDAEVGKKHGLRRGEKGSKAKHTSIRSFYAALKTVGTLEKLPKRVPVPQVPELGIMSSKVEKERIKALAHERELALEHNRKVQVEIARLAELALATHGRARRKLPKQLSDAAEIIERAGVYSRIERIIEERLSKLPPKDKLEIEEQLKAQIKSNPQTDQQPKTSPTSQQSCDPKIPPRKTPRKQS